MEEELYNFEQVIAYAVIGLNNLLKSANKDNINLKDFAELFMKPLNNVHKKENVVEHANRLISN